MLLRKFSRVSISTPKRCNKVSNPDRHKIVLKTYLEAELTHDTL